MYLTEKNEFSCGSSKVQRMDRATAKGFGQFAGKGYSPHEASFGIEKLNKMHDDPLGKRAREGSSV